MINVSKIKKGIVLDHIEHGMGYEVYRALHLDKVDEPVVLMQNIDSSSKGKKDLIKIETDLDLDFTVLGLIAPYTTVNFIEDGKRVRKFRMELPQEVEGVLNCHNPRCISNVEKVQEHRFYLYHADRKEYRCEYCDSIAKYED